MEERKLSESEVENLVNMANVATPVTSSFQDELARVNVKLRDGRTVQLFVNRRRNLVVLDIIDADEQGGVEVYRKEV